MEHTTNWANGKGHPIPVFPIKTFTGLIIPIILVLWLASGIYIVDPDEQAVVRRFGRVARLTEPGPHYRLPSPIEQVDKVKVKQVKRIEIGFRTIKSTSPARYSEVSAEALMLTGDEQIVHAEVIVQYLVSDAKAYLFNVKDLEATEGALKDATEVALRQIVGKRPIDDVLIQEKLQIEIDIRQFLADILAAYDSGLRIIEVKLQTVRPPKEVAQAFNDVVSAKEDKDRYVKEAEGFNEDLIPKARGQAQMLIRQAEAYKEERVKRAQGDAERFLAVLAEYKKAKNVTTTRLYLETMEEILPGMEKFIVDPALGSNLLPFLPITKPNSGS